MKKDKKGNFTYEPLVADKISKLKIQEEAEAPPIKLSGQIYQTLPGDVPKSMEVYAVNDAGEIIAIATVDAKGNFVFDKLPADKNISFRLKDSGGDAQIVIKNEKNEVVETITQDKKGNFDFVSLKGDKGSLTSITSVDAKMIKLKKEEIKEAKLDTAGIFTVIYYGYDKAELSKAELTLIVKELDAVAEILHKNPEMKVDLTAHTDSRGSAEYNQQLSNRRAKAATSYLMLEGIKKERITGKGMGESAPAAPNENPDGSDNPAGRAKNRRAEIRIVPGK